MWLGWRVVKYLSAATATAIIRAPRDHYRLLWAALTFMGEVPSDTRVVRGVVCRVVRVSGTIRKCEEEAIRRARRSILRAKKEEPNLLEGIVGGDDVMEGAAREEEPYGDVMDMDEQEEDDDDDDDDDASEDEDL